MNKIKLKLKPSYSAQISCYSEDIARMKKILGDRGYEAEEESICVAWERYSESFAAGWLILGDYEDVFNNLMLYLEPA